MTHAENHFRTLNELRFNNRGVWPDELATAAKWALDEIEKLTVECRDLKSQLEWERKQWRQKQQYLSNSAHVDNLSEIRRLKARANRLITDRMFPGKLTDNDLTKEVIE